MPLSCWALLGFVVWTLIVLIVTIGVPRVTKVLTRQASANSFNPSVPHGSERYQRCMRAHLNCVENLPVFASLVVLGALVSMTDPSFQVAASVVLPARMLQTVVHVWSGRNRAVLARFTFFSVQLLCFAVMAALLAARGIAQR
jgi:uncharacterized MAPEG superfamily protein